MKKLLLLFSVCALFAQGIDAKSITVDQARAIAMQQTTKSFKSSNANLSLGYSARNLKGQTDYYVFNRDGGQGFVIVAGDDLSTPVLAYSTTGTFNMTTAPEPIKDMLKGYQDQMEWMRNHPQKLQGSTPSLRMNPEGVYPLFMNEYGEEVHWHQFEPYNQYCPNTPQGRSYAGCAPIAFAQIMKGLQHPYRGAGEITYSYLLNGQEMTVTSNLANHTYKYRNMKNGYSAYTSGWQDVAQLVFDAGAGFHTRFSASSSDASYKDIVKGMIAYFDYNPNVQFLLRQNYADQTWREMIYTELDEGRPVYYFGYRTVLNDGTQNAHVGHAFVVDGYDSEGKVHILFGFQPEEYNAYFDFDLMSPRIYGDTPYEHDQVKEGFNADQGAIIGIRPALEDEPGGIVQKAVNLVADTMPATDIRATIDVQALSGPWSGTLRCGIVSKNTSSNGSVSYSTYYTFNKEVSVDENGIASIDVSGSYPMLSNGQTYYFVIWSPYFPNNYDWNWFLDDPVPFTIGDWVTPPDPQFILGDVNNDGKLSIGDVTALINYLLSGDATDINLDAADCDQNGEIKIGDVTELINMLLTMPAE